MSIKIEFRLNTGMFKQYFNDLIVSKWALPGRFAMEKRILSELIR